jgi:ribonuclease-3
MARDLQRLMTIIGYEFNNIELLEQAFLHSSCINERRIKRIESYERLEFLGDAVLELITSEGLYQRFPDKQEGELTRIRSSLVCEYCLAECARELHYPEYVLLGKGERMCGGADRDSILCDLFESVLGAIYLDGGLEPARGYVERFLLDDMEHKRLFYDAKTHLQEVAQQSKLGEIRYELYDTQGPDHDKHFFVQLYLDNEPYAKAEGHSIKDAEQKAAYHTLLSLNASL